MQWSLGQEIEEKFRMIVEKFRMIVEKFRQELWEKKKGNLDKTLSNLCQGLYFSSVRTKSDNCLIAFCTLNELFTQKVLFR